MKGIQGYSKPNGQGGVTVDVESMLVDMITVYKAGGRTLDELVHEASRIWPEVIVNVKYPRNS